MGATFVGASVVGAAIVGAVVVGATVVGATVVGAAVWGVDFGEGANWMWINRSGFKQEHFVRWDLDQERFEILRSCLTGLVGMLFDSNPSESQ